MNNLMFFFSQQSWTCQCAAPYYGFQCKNAGVACGATVCLNGGLCQALKCICSIGFNGSDCSQPGESIKYGPFRPPFVIPQQEPLTACQCADVICAEHNLPYADWELCDEEEKNQLSSGTHLTAGPSHSGARKKRVRSAHAGAISSRRSNLPFPALSSLYTLFSQWHRHTFNQIGFRRDTSDVVFRAVSSAAAVAAASGTSVISPGPTLPGG